MRRNAHYPRYLRYPRPEVPVPRRGNSIVLVMGILVLLVIIATAFITRTHAGRVTANAMQRATLRDDNARVIAEMLAQEVALALFTQPVDPFDPEVLDGLVADSNFPRLSSLRNPIRYGVDQDIDGDGLPDFPYNVARYHVVPSTNWPDVDAGMPNPLAMLWPAGPGNSGPGAGGASPFLDFEGNVVGNPGFNDARWLADIEPLRKDTNGNGVLDAYSQWRHMTNIARPNNGWRIVSDISDVTASLIIDLNIPVEQWLASILPANAQAGNPDAALPANNIFEAQWGTWFDFGLHQEFHFHALEIPANFYNLSDLNANGFFLEPGERPQDEFIGGTARWNAGRVLADTDGDGFTDAFWFLAPTMTERGIRQIVAVRIIDNSAMLNVNVATRFNRLDTTGATPAGLALVGQLASPGFGDTWNVGFYDNLANWFVGPDNDQDGQPDYETGYELPNPSENTDDDFPWLRHVVEVGLLDTNGNPILMPDHQTRLAYWREAGRLGFAPLVGSVLTPFNLADELELRMFCGQNYPWIFSRYESSIQFASAGPSDQQFLRAKVSRKESSEYLDQLGNQELVFDHRKQLTMYNGARNDEMPPWLWWRWDIPPDVLTEAAANPGEPVVERFLAQARTKLDLREEVNPILLLGERDLGYRLPRTLLLALIDGDENAGTSYFDEYTLPTDPTLEDARKAAAGLAANILQWRDDDPLADPPLNLADAVRLPGIPGTPGIPEDDAIRMLGMERQPFLLEAFIGHVYETYVIPGDPDGLGYTNSEHRIIIEDDDGGNSLQSTVVVVQIANPYDKPIVLHDPSNPDLPRYEIELFDQTPISLEAIAEALGPGFFELPPARDNRPSTMILYSIDPALAGEPNFRTQWLNFLDIELGDHPSGVGGTIIVNLQDPAFAIAVPDPWDTDRDTYDDDGVMDEAVRLIRKYDPQGTATSVVIDRIDDPGGPVFLAEVNSQGNPAANKPPKYVDLAPIPPMDIPPFQMMHPDGGWEPADQAATHWVQWVRISRAWGNDDNGDGLTNSSERNPRYIYASNALTTADDPSTLDPRLGYAARIFRGPLVDGEPGVSFTLANNPDNEPGDQNLPWMTLDHTPAGGLPAFARKPTFFDMNGGLVTGYPDKGYYHSDYSLQMLQKEADFEQVGELLNVWMFGHELAFDIPDVYVGTTETFSEFMIDADLTTNIDDPLVNRLRLEPTSAGAMLGQVVGKPLTGNSDPMYLLDFQHAVPALPAGARVLDAFVCDDRGVNGTAGLDEYFNANRFTGRITPGLININTAPVEVMRAVPHMTRLVHEIGSPGLNPFVRVADAIVRYRERFGDPMNTMDPLPAYGVRITDLRGERGIASIGELMLLTEPASFPGPLPPLEPNENWQIDFAALDPFGFEAVGQPIESTQISTDVNDVFDPNLPGDVPDEVAEDAEESNLLFAGMSNMITTRSDVFTVYFKVRSFVQNPTTGVWDATNPEFIVDDSRYVMLVDRSEVNHPNDKPKILYLEKLPK